MLVMNDKHHMQDHNELMLNGTVNGEDRGRLIPVDALGDARGRDEGLSSSGSSSSFFVPSSPTTPPSSNTLMSFLHSATHNNHTSLPYSDNDTELGLMGKSIQYGNNGATKIHTSTVSNDATSADAYRISSSITDHHDSDANLPLLPVTNKPSSQPPTPAHHTTTQPLPLPSPPITRASHKFSPPCLALASPSRSALVYSTRRAQQLGERSSSTTTLTPSPSSPGNKKRVSWTDHVSGGHLALIHSVERFASEDMYDDHDSTLARRNRRRRRVRAPEWCLFLLRNKYLLLISCFVILLVVMLSLIVVLVL
eukprot:TRINITY_DN7865_c0_g1_i1.p1 TRINITY_DN7865_c0_g1~~TRINITY_DN7865_c0_g1_i1.p1  ORF type:complete len:310 (+),score=70.25 TRINITY_DN7865_c0_g1_i1:142-1071(+)